MLKEPDTQKFVEAMEVEVTFRFKGEIWVVVPKQKMLAHYSKMRADGQDIKRH